MTEPHISFNTERVEIGDYITATVTGAINTSNYDLFVVGYSESGAVTFVEKGNGTVSATVAEDTAVIKTMLWDKNMSPISETEIIYAAQ